jgi:muramidase (phage lysozyme)
MATIKTDKRLAAFLDLIAFSEGTSSSPATRADGYDIIVSGIDGSHTFTDYSAHPFSNGRGAILVRAGKAAIVTSAPTLSGQAPHIIKPAVPEIESTASGRYQITLPTWRDLCSGSKLSTFDPTSQDVAGLMLIQRRQATELILSSRIAAAIYACREEWASFPGGPYDQPQKSQDNLVQCYISLLDAQAG